MSFSDPSTLRPSVGAELNNWDLPGIGNTPELVSFLKIRALKLPKVSLRIQYPSSTPLESSVKYRLTVRCETFAANEHKLMAAFQISISQTASVVHCETKV